MDSYELLSSVAVSPRLGPICARSSCVMINDTAEHRLTFLPILSQLCRLLFKSQFTGGNNLSS
jgi:hypothetical protein